MKEVNEVSWLINDIVDESAQGIYGKPLLKGLVLLEAYDQKEFVMGIISMIVEELRHQSEGGDE